MFGSQLSPGFGYRYSQQYLLVEYRFDNMSSNEESIVTTLYLPNLRILEQDTYMTRDNSDTSVASVWTRNPLELKERVTNFDYWRKRLGDFFGIVPIYAPGSSVSLVI